MASPSTTTNFPEKPSSGAALWDTITRFDTSKIEPLIAFRNAVGLTVPLALAVAFGNPTAGTIATTGALSVAFSDGSDPYIRRAKRMLTATIFVSLAIFIGALSGRNDLVAIVLVTTWAFAAGMLIAIDSAWADIGLISLVTLVVFGARPMSVEEAAYSGAIALGGGLFQTSLSLSFWPVRRHEPQRRAVGELYRGLAELASEPVKAWEAPPASTTFSEAHQVLAGAWGFRSGQAERFWSLLSQAERIRLSLLMIFRLRARLAREDPSGAGAEILDECRQLASRILIDISRTLLVNRNAATDSESVRRISIIAETQLEPNPQSHSADRQALIREARYQIDALAGQLRSAIELASYSTPVGRKIFERKQANNPWMLRVAGTMATLQANLSLDSAVCRHAIRLAACVGIGHAIGRSVDWERTYWLTMTVAIILKPDFTATFSRGVLRLIGTFAGLFFATVLFHFLPLGPFLEVAFIAVLGFAMRCYGPANYGLFVIAISALIVMLFALTGVAPAEVVASRGLNTAAGGLLAIAAYAIWPTWERTQVSETLAQMLDRYREYFRAVRYGFVGSENEYSREIDRIRLVGRLARSNLEGSVERLRAEPRFPAASLTQLYEILASSHRFVHAVMALEAGLSRSQPVPARPEFHAFANAVELTLHSLSAALRGSPLDPADLPNLRDAHNALLQAGDPLAERYALVNVESDRITNSVNTLTLQVFQWLSQMQPTVTQ
ncbi:MAG TPA: FUSC family protein [Bryobacteraceae bacterium]|nr:FUSC family protein [Bryobacteraceae bacterium]